MSFADKVKKLINEAPVVSSGMNVNFGPMVVTPMVIRWAGRGNPPVKTPLLDYMAEHDIKDADDIELEKGKESFQLHFDIDVSVLNPALDFHYERDVAILESYHNPKNPEKDILTDWSEIVLPSLETVFGKNWYDKVLPNGKKAAPVFHVAAENTDSLAPVKEGKKNYGVPKLIAVYGSLAECRKARDERYPPREEQGEEVPEDESDDDEEEGEFPADALKGAYQLYNSSRKNEKQTLKMLGTYPFGEYDPKELLKAALAAEE
jgi:hypothetical protein